MSAAESKHQIDWAERDLAIILTLLWQCLRSAPQRRAELGRHRTGLVSAFQQLPDVHTAI